MRDNPSNAMNRVQLAVLTARFEGVARKMANTLHRTGRSGILTIARDFSCVILTARHELLTASDSLPIHVLRGPEVMCKTMTDNHPQLRRGDAYLHNSPYHGCTHPADHSILVPVIDDDGIHRFTVLAKGHQADCGNSLPSTYMGAAKDVYAEGALIFPAVKIQSDYQHQMDLVRMCQLRIRVPEQWWGDYLATLGAARVGEREILALGREVGWQALEDYASAWFDYSEERMRAAIRGMPKGRITRKSRHDPFPATPPDGVEVTVTVDIDPEAERIEVDVRDNIGCLENGLNLSEACARSAPMVGIFNSIDHTVPKNEGSFRRISVLLKENSAVGLPKHPTSCSVATTNLADRVSNPVQCAIAELGDGLGMAESGACIPASSGVVSGVHDGQPFVNEVYLGCTGGAGAPSTDGWLTIMHTGNAGMCYQDSIEIDELRHPIFVKARRLMADTEGAGRFRGAVSAYSEFSPVGCAMTVAYVSDGNVNPARGVRGGLSGAPSAQYVRRAGGALEPTPGCAEVLVQPDEAMVSISCGGGGYGPPEARDPALVLRDVREGWVSRARAESVYRVAVTDALELDAARTANLRKG
ncbi:hydantoinase B/oxoprolinase family protein [Nordella sp. HKS 07]|uniref:hydantoinase B/oxoprolinase family protein n=1 Tax=Nordella sp. HKS 07 TaxID=2712222 RepID=UPI0013E11CF5|nr:hydantoinase B/oxoprolinase family protein [Nordella sp. HKS 07]QIG48252.1 hydantoinase B/oxoprolinase family protein [Nordella sp. HKS 07]